MVVSFEIDRLLIELFPGELDVEALLQGDSQAERRAVESLSRFYRQHATDVAVAVDQRRIIVEIADFELLDDQDPLLLRVAEALRENDHDAAQTVVEELLATRPFEAQALRYRGVLYQLQEDAAAAEELYLEALRWNPWDVPCLSLMGQLLASADGTEEDRERAIWYLERAAAVDPHNIGNLVNIAAVFMTLGEVDRATTQLYRLLEHEPDHPDALLQLAIIAEQRDDHREAFRLSVEAMKNSGRSGTTDYTRALSIARSSAQRLAGDSTDQLDTMVEQIGREIADSGQRQVVIQQDPSIPAAAMLHMADPNGSAAHRVYFRDRDIVSYHLIINQLMVLRKTMEARQDGNSLKATTSEPQFQRFRERVQEEKGTLPTDTELRGVFAGVTGQVVSVPMDLFAEATIFDELPDFRPVQFLALEQMVRQNAEAVSQGAPFHAAPAAAANAAVVYGLVVALFFRAVYGFDLVAEFSASEEQHRTAMDFYTAFLDAARTDLSGEAWRLSLAWSETLGLGDYLSFESDTAKGAGPGIPPGEAPVVITATTVHYDAVVDAIEAALAFFDDLDRRRIVMVAQEIADLGMAGINPHDTSRVYGLRNVPGVSFSGRALLSWLYTAFRLLEAGVDPGFDYSAEYQEALERFRKS